MSRFRIESILGDGYERFAIVQDGEGKELCVHFLQTDEYLDNVNVSTKKYKTGDIIEGTLLIDLVCRTRNSEIPCMHIQRIKESSHIEAVVIIKQIIDDYSVYAYSDITEESIKIAFEQKVTFQVNERAYLEGSLELELM